MQNIVKFWSHSRKQIVFCCIDLTDSACDNWAREITKNQSDYTISNIYNKGYEVFQGKNEDNLLNFASEYYDYAVVYASGTEFINGDCCFQEFEKECNENFFIKGHILDRKEAYYELHHQCYLINLKIYRKLGKPIVGTQILGDCHQQPVPNRSKENIHDNYTPLLVSPGDETEEFSHKCHGWNIISCSLKNGYSIRAFKDSIRNNKFYLYSESEKDFYKQVKRIFFKHHYCLADHVHTRNTEWQNQSLSDIVQVVSPASGEWYLPNLSLDEKVKIILYDYNKNSIEYWREAAKKLPNIEYQFVKVNLLLDANELLDCIDKSLEDRTLINLSNIFCYEGTCDFYNLKYRNKAETEMLIKLKNKVPNAYINFAARASAGFVRPQTLIKKCKDIEINDIDNFVKPTWHNNDWL